MSEHGAVYVMNVALVLVLLIFFSVRITVCFKISSLSDENLEKLKVPYLSPANLNKQKTLN